MMHLTQDFETLNSLGHFFFQVFVFRDRICCAARLTCNPPFSFLSPQALGSKARSTALGLSPYGRGNGVTVQHPWLAKAMCLTVPMFLSTEDAKLLSSGTGGSLGGHSPFLRQGN